MITGTNIKKTFDGTLQVLNDISFHIEPGDIYGLVGRSGAGKSTLLRCINGLCDYQEGSLRVMDREVSTLTPGEMREFRKHIGMVFQHFSLLERRSVYKNIAIPMECWGYSKEEIDQKVKSLLELVELSDKADVKPRHLSGGQKQRVAIARALTMEPKILLCDEATSALDPNTTNSILDLLYRINQESGITIVVVTHQMEVVKRICNKLSILENGAIAVAGGVSEVFQTEHPALKNLLGTENVQAWLKLDEPRRER